MIFCCCDALIRRLVGVERAVLIMSAKFSFA